jgi:hypothetical protein
LKQVTKLDQMVKRAKGQAFAQWLEAKDIL